MAADGTVLLDAPASDPDTGLAVARLFSSPLRAIRADTQDDVVPALEKMDTAVAAGAWVAGWMTYEAGYSLEPRLARIAPDSTPPLLWFGVYDAPVEFDPEVVGEALGPPTNDGVHRPTLALGPQEYAGAIAALREHIAEGDIYQANLTAPLTFSSDSDPLALYARLRMEQPAPYAAFVGAAGRSILSLSPELFFRIDGATITARPMKGTAPVETGGAALAADPKNRAENLMIVDLLRNDLSRVSQPGSVQVPALFEVQRYPTLWQMTSTVTAELVPDWTIQGVIRALFPCGSITGAPKIRAMEILRRIEREPRGVYCGAIGYAGPTGAAFSVPIRTIELEPSGAAWRGRMGLGSGVVWDSIAEDEYAECLLKGRFLTDLAAAPTPI